MRVRRAGRPWNPLLLRLTVDVLLTMAILALLSFQMTGLKLHEWIGLSFGIAMFVHMLFGWRWIAGMTKRIFSSLPWKTRLNYVLTLLLFVVLVGVVYSGLVISRVVIPTFGIDLPGVAAAAEGGREGGGGGGQFWESFHRGSTNLVLVLVAMHVGLNFSMVVLTIRLRIVKPIRGLAGMVIALPKSVRKAGL